MLSGHYAPHSRTATQVNKAEGMVRGCFVTICTCTYISMHVCLHVCIYRHVCMHNVYCERVPYLEN